MTRPRVLIAGASIAGPALAYWMHRYGWHTTIIERAPAQRTGGQNIDVRGAGREVTRRMGLEETIRQATTGEVGTRFIGAGGVTVAEFPVRESESGGATAELEILRGDLAQLLVDATLPHTEYRYGNKIVDIRQTDAHALVTFEDGPDEQFDLVVAADGIGSSTRGLVFGDADTFSGKAVAPAQPATAPVRIRSLGMETSWATIPRTPADDDWWRWYNATGGRNITLRPDPAGTIRATLSVQTDARQPRADRSPADQRAHLRALFADAGWEAARVLDGFDAADDLYYESIGQVSAPRWTSGRVALLGDAAYCASPVSGMGTSLSLAGAYVLAGEIAAHVDLRDAFRGYERIMRPYVDQAQDLPPGVPRVANPQTRAGITAFHTAVRVGATPWGGKVAAGLFAPPADKIDLPDYAHLER